METLNPAHAACSHDTGKTAGVGYGPSFAGFVCCLCGARRSKVVMIACDREDFRGVSYRANVNGRMVSVNRPY